MNTSHETPRLLQSRLASLRNAVGAWLLGCILGFVCFVLIGKQLRAMSDPLWAAVWWQLSFGVGLALILGIIVVMTRIQHSSLADIGWQKPTSKKAIIGGVILGGLYVAGVYAGILNDPSMRNVNPFELNWVRFFLIPLGVFMAVVEEMLMRGYFMTQLSNASVPPWAQIVMSGACSAAYHSFHNLTWIGFIPSFVLFSLHAFLYVAAKRSLTPSVIAHSMYHVLCAPYLLMFAMAQMAA